jgi:hypothetical protein
LIAVALQAPEAVTVVESPWLFLPPLANTTLKVLPLVITELDLKVGTTAAVFRVGVAKLINLVALIAVSVTKFGLETVT